MPKYDRVIAVEDGWSDWQRPIKNGYRLGCCDCGLVHNLKLRAVTDDDREIWIEYKVSVNKRATAAKRRKKSIKED